MGGHRARARFARYVKMVPVRDQIPGKLPNDLGEGNAREWISADIDNDDAFRVLRELCFVPATGELVGPLNLRVLCTYLKCLTVRGAQGLMQLQ